MVVSNTTKADLFLFSHTVYVGKEKFILEHIELFGNSRQVGNGRSVLPRRGNSFVYSMPH